MRAYGLFWKTYFFGSFLIPASPVNPHLFITTVFFKALISPAIKLGGRVYGTSPIIIRLVT